MSHNTFGHLSRVTTWGESHGPALGCVVDGCPPGIPLTAAECPSPNACSGHATSEGEAMALAALAVSLGHQDEELAHTVSAFDRSLEALQREGLA